MEKIIYTTPQQTLDFFNFQFDVLAGQVIACRMDWQPIDTAIWSWLFLVKQKYDEKNERLKKRTKIFEEKQKRYEEIMENTLAHNRRCKEHIQKAEAKLTEYKNTILAFGKLATCNSISK